MEKSLTLIVAATVLIFAGLIAVFMTSSSFTDLDDERKNQQNTCQFECSQYDGERGARIDDGCLSSCVDGGYMSEEEALYLGADTKSMEPE